MRRSSSGPWAAEVLLFFQRADWPEGLEADTVLPVLRGRMAMHREAVYVGVARARFLLVILTDDLRYASLPKSFGWD